MPNPLNYFSKNEVFNRQYIIEHGVDEVVLADKNICVIWQINGEPVRYKDILLSINWLSKYVLYGGYIMDYDSTQRSVIQYTGRDGLTRKWIIEANVFSGTSYNGRSWCAVSQDNFMKLVDTVHMTRPTIPRVILFEMGRAMYNLKLDNILDWQMEVPSHTGYWALAFAEAMTVLMPELIGCNKKGNRKARLADLKIYVNEKRYNFQNTWSTSRLPWNTNQSISDLMAGLLIKLYDNYGEIVFLHHLCHFLCLQSDTYTARQQKQRATNFAKACCLAVLEISGKVRAQQIHDYLCITLRWHFIGECDD